MTVLLRCRHSSLGQSEMSLVVATSSSQNWLQVIFDTSIDACAKADGGQVVSRQSVVASCDAPKVLKPVESAFDTPAQLIEAFAKAERLLSVAAVGNDRLGAVLTQFLA